MRPELLEELLLGVLPNDAICLASVLEEDHRRDRANAESSGRDRIGINVKLGDLHFFALLVRDLFEYRSDHPTGAAPGRPEVDEHRSIGFDDFRLEVLVADYLWLGHAPRPAVLPMIVAAPTLRRASPAAGPLRLYPRHAAA